MLPRTNFGRKVVTGIVLSFIVLLLAYCVAAAYYAHNFEVLFNEPFSRLYNIYTPVFMICFFMLFEGCFILMMRAGDKPTASVSTDNARSGDGEAAQSQKEVAAEMYTQIDKTLEQYDGKSAAFAGESETVKEEKAEELPDFELSDVMFVELLDLHYTNDQIRAITRLGKYLPDLSVADIKKIFNPAMSPEEITEFIRDYYEA